jgi:hypothetical protein
MTRDRSSISRAHFSNWLITTLEAFGNPVGDAHYPRTTAYGWQGEPNVETSFFIPWLASTPGTARVNPAPRGGAFGDSGKEWTLSYSISYNAVDREQVEWLADSTRKSLVNTERVEVDCGDYGTWQIQQAQCITVGGVLRIRSTDPDYYVQTDAFDIWVSKE